jgi:flagellar biosynthesis/type III secretory pathway M-ring protein FliF/YscJ
MSQALNSPTLMILIIAGIVGAVFLLLAMIAWTIRVRRAENMHEPTQQDLQDALRNAQRERDSAGMDLERIREHKGELPELRIFQGSLPEGKGTRSVPRDLLFKAVPGLSILMELGKVVRESEEGKAAQTPEEKNEAFRKALERMLEQQPDNALLRQMLNALPVGDGASHTAAVDDERIQVYRIGGKTAIRVDGVEFSSASDISDPEVRSKVRELISRLLE